MTQPTKPTATATPETAAATATRTGTGTGTIDPTVPMPKSVAMYEDRVVPVEEAQQRQEVYLTEQLVDTVLTDYRRVLLEPGHGRSLAACLSRLTSLGAMRAGLVENLAPRDMPDNADQVPEAAEAVVRTARDVPEGSVMGVDQGATSQKLVRAEFLKTLVKETSWFPALLQKNLAHTLGALDDTARGAVSRARSLLDYNTRLKEGLRPATDLIDGPGRKGAMRRRENEALKGDTRAELRVEEATRAQVQAPAGAPVAGIPGFPGAPGGVVPGFVAPVAQPVAPPRGGKKR